MVNEVRQKARELLEGGEVQVVIGYGEGLEGRVRPIFIRKSEGIQKLLFDERCTQNLAVYLLKPEVKALGKPAILAPIPVVRSIDRLASEHQIADGSVTILGISNDGSLLYLPDLNSLRAFVAQHPLELSPLEEEQIHKIAHLSAAERWAFWREKFSECLKCYACRASCPLCYCSRCTVECNQPQWISPVSHQLGNFEWHLMRAMHLAGRCINCGECMRACPLDIPLNLLTQCLIEEVQENFKGDAEGKTELIYPLSTFSVEDKDNFIS